MNSRRWEGILSLVVVVAIVVTARSTAFPPLMAIADLITYLCILAAVVWIGRALVRRLRGSSTPDTVDPRGPKGK